MKTDVPARYPRRLYVASEACECGLPHALVDTLSTLGVPESFIGRFQSFEHLKVVRSSSDQCYVNFGRGLNNEMICLDPVTGHVVSLDPPDYPVKREPFFVNSSIFHFTKIVENLLDEVPFFEVDDSVNDEEFHAYLDTVARVMEGLRTIVREADPPSAEVDSFWMTFIDDAEMGSFIDVVAPARAR